MEAFYQDVHQTLMSINKPFEIVFTLPTTITMRCVLTIQPFTPRLCNAPKFILHGKLYNIAAEKGTSKVLRSYRAATFIRPKSFVDLSLGWSQLLMGKV